MTSYQLSPAAIQDPEEIEAYVADQRPSAVEGVLDAIESACPLVAGYPGVGRSREEIDEGVMSFPIGPYIIFYYRDDDPFGIARILHASRDLPTAFPNSIEANFTLRAGAPPELIKQLVKSSWMHGVVGHDPRRRHALSGPVHGQPVARNGGPIGPARSDALSGSPPN